MAAYLLGVSALLFYVNVHTFVPAYSDAHRRRKNATYMAAWALLLASGAAALAEVR